MLNNAKPHQIKNNKWLTIYIYSFIKIKIEFFIEEKLKKQTKKDKSEMVEGR